MRKIIFFLMVVALMLTPCFSLKKTTIYLPAVQETQYGYKGVLAQLEVEIREGEGHVYVDTWPLTKISTQASARLAKEVACNLLSIDCSRYDFFYSIRSDAPIVGGPSGGAAMTIATLASLLDLNLSKEVLITGTIAPNGLIGPVGGILEKAEAVSKKAKLFLIPIGESKVKISKTQIKQIGPITIGTSKEEVVDVKKYAKEHWNLEVKEVATIQEAFEYFTGYRFKKAKIGKVENKYKEVMKDMSSSLINYAKNLYENLSKKLKESSLPYQYQIQLNKILEKKVDESWFNKGDYYSAASKAFGNAILYNYGIKEIELLKSDSPSLFVKTYLQKIEESIPSLNENLSPELLAILEERVDEAKSKIEDGWKNYYEGNYFDALYDGSYAEVRVYTIKLWIDFVNRIEGKELNISKRELKDIASTQLQDAIGLITYAELNGANTYKIEEAKRIYEKAKESFINEKYLLSIIQSLKAKANAEIALELIYSDIDTILEIQRDIALKAIANSDSVMGYSYFEYAENLKNEDKESSLIYYVYAEKVSSLNSLLKKSKKKVGLEERKEELIEKKEEFGCQDKQLVEGIFLGIVIGVVFALTLTKITPSSHKRKRRLV